MGYVRLKSCHSGQYSGGNICGERSELEPALPDREDGHLIGHLLFEVWLESLMGLRRCFNLGFGLSADRGRCGWFSQPGTLVGLRGGEDARRAVRRASSYACDPECVKTRPAAARTARCQLTEAGSGSQP